MALRLSTPDTFSAFPYDEPYQIQLDLMRHLYAAIEDECVTIVESPTGTGKTASLLCATISWLLDNRERAKKGILNEFVSNDETDWVSAQTLERHKREMEMEEREYHQRLTRARKREAAMKKMLQGRAVKRQKISHPAEIGTNEGESFLPENTSDEESSNIHPKLREMMQRMEKDITKGDDEEPTCIKVYYASRTHSQLAQVLHELRRIRLSRITPLIEILGEQDGTDQQTARVVSLASRKQLCINEKLKQSAGDLDEKCRQILGDKGESRCPYLPHLEDEIRMLDFRDQILATPKDIEDLVVAGKLSQTCPYFGSRRAIRQAQVVALPYNLLLSKQAREALGIDLTNQIIVIDEAHNLVSTLLALSSATLNISTLTTSIEQISTYLSKFRLRLSHKHLLLLQKLKITLEALYKYIAEWKHEQQRDSGNISEMSEVITVGELVLRMGRKTEGINLLEINCYLKTSKIARKISNYADDGSQQATVPPLQAVETFLTTLTASSHDGRISLSIAGNTGQVEVKYQQLNPSTNFLEIVESARSVILAGGTMSPISDIISQLFSKIPIEKLRSFSCGHIVPDSNLQTLVVKKGPSGRDLLFKFQQKNDTTLISELGQVLLNIVNVAPAGVVVFFPSYSFLNTVQQAWSSSAILDKIGQRKTVFREPSEHAQVESILREYEAEIQKYRSGPPVGKKTGAVLMAVIGAKLSEGLNFSDDLARAVVVVGLPFPNIKSAELQERMRYVSKLSKENGENKDAGRELYENICMNAVNQSIGRAIRHQHDWSCLILIDNRYSSPRIRDKLPKWISGGIQISETFGATMKALGTFYRTKRETA